MNARASGSRFKDGFIPQVIVIFVGTHNITSHKYTGAVMSFTDIILLNLFATLGNIIILANTAMHKLICDV